MKLQNTMDEQQQPVAEAPVSQPVAPIPTPPAPDPIPAPIPQPMPVPPPAPAPQAPAPQAPQPPIPTPAPPIDLSGNKGMAILAYLGILIIVPFVTEAKNDPFVKFHLKQGLVLIIVWIAAGILISILSSMFYVILGRFAFLFSFLFPIIYLGLGIIDIVGIINAATGKQKELPIIGQFARSFNF